MLDLSDVGSAPLPLVGGKALNLGKLTAAGFPVPRGFCLTTRRLPEGCPAGLEALAAHLDAGCPRPPGDGSRDAGAAGRGPAEAAGPGGADLASWRGRRAR